MKESKDHINIDLEFLDRKAPPRVTSKPDSHTGQTSGASTPISTGYAYNWKNILIIGGIILFLGWAISSGSGNSNSAQPSPNTSNYEIANPNPDNNVSTGQYMCSQYNHNRAGELEPSTSQESTLKSEEVSLPLEGDRLSAEKDQLQNEYVDESDQYSIDTHNAAIDDLNSRLASYRYRLTQHSRSIDAYNAKVEVYNNYLIHNCTPR